MKEEEEKNCKFCCSIGMVRDLRENIFFPLFFSPMIDSGFGCL